MKILKIFGFVVGIHVFALILIFANPGCSSNTKPPPAPVDTVSGPPPSVSVPLSPSPSAGAVTGPSPSISFNPDAPAVGSIASAASSGRTSPTRPGSAVATVIAAEPVKDVTPATTYTVKSGDSLWTIAKKYNLTVPQLAAANSLSSGTNIKPGQKLIIPSGPTSLAPGTAASPAPGAGKSTPAAGKGGADTPAAKSTAGAAGGGIKHVVKGGETLGAIARTYGVKTADLAVANNISDPAKIRPGMELTIPGWESVSKSGKSGASKSGGTPPAQKSAPAAPPTVPVEAPAAQQPPPVVPIDEGPSLIVPAPKGR